MNSMIPPDGLTQIRPEFVTFAPAVLKPGVLYVSMEYATMLHACCCGCGNKVVTPLAPKRWHLTYDGKTISVEPSIGNWAFPCQSHYWIERNAVIWDRPFTSREIAVVRAKDQRDMKAASRNGSDHTQSTTSNGQITGHAQARKTWSRRLLDRLQGGLR